MNTYPEISVHELSTLLDVFLPKTSSCMYALRDHHMTLLNETDCSFFITQAIELPGGGYELCVQANDQVSDQSWEVFMDGTPSGNGTGPNVCWIFPNGNPFFFIYHYIGNEKCLDVVYIMPNSACREGILRAGVENCDLETSINIDTSSVGIPYVITFGDGSLAQQSSSPEITYTYSQPGTYDICLTYLVPGTEIGYVTCCYQVVINLPLSCLCTQNIIHVLSVEPCTWKTTMLFVMDSQNLPLWVNFGDGASDVFNSLWITHDFPNAGNYNVCSWYERRYNQIALNWMAGTAPDSTATADLRLMAGNLLDVSPDGDMLLDNYGAGWAKLLSFDRCSGEVALIDTIATGITPLMIGNGEVFDTWIYDFIFSPSGRYLYGAGWAEFAQWDLEAPDIAASKVKLGGVPWAQTHDFSLLVGTAGGFTAFAHGPDGKIYNLHRTSHSVIHHPDEKGAASGLCLAADNAPVSCLGPSVPPYDLYSNRHPNYRLGPLTGSGCDSLPSGTKEPVMGSGYGVTASPTVASGQVEVSIALPAYGSHITAELQVVDMQDRAVERHRFPPYAYLHRLDVSGWPAGLYNVVLMEGGRARGTARVVVAR